jgi:alkylmercury lyase
METGRPNVPELLSALMGALPNLDDMKRRVALATYRRLACGVPAPVEEIAVDAGVDAEEVRRILGDWIGVYTDDQKRVIGFWGLAIPKMKHRFEVDGVRLYTWCAWDTLFLPELLGKTARIESACATSGELVRLTVSPKRLEAAEPASPFVSFLAPDPSRFKQDVIENFCHYVHFFRSREDGEAWVSRNPGTFLLRLAEAAELARLKNEAQFGVLLRGSTQASVAS